MLIYTDRSMCRYQSYYPSHYQYTNKREMFPPVREEVAVLVVMGGAKLLLSSLGISHHLCCHRLVGWLCPRTSRRI